MPFFQKFVTSIQVSVSLHFKRTKLFHRLVFLISQKDQAKAIMRYDTINRSWTMFFYTFYTSINAICEPGEVGVGYAGLCLHPHDVDSCDEPEAGAILTNDCSIINASKEASVCLGGWPALAGEVLCNSDDFPVIVDTPAAYFGDCYDSGLKADDVPCRTPTVKKPWKFSLSFCCKRTRDKVWNKK